jgi:hypothetical protein
MLRKIVAIVVGVVVGFIIVFIGDATTHKLNPASETANHMDKEEMTAYINSMPAYVMVIMCIFWVLAAFLGGLVAAKIHSLHWKQCSLITGGILLAATLLNLTMTPHPTWMWIVALLLILPAAYLGGKLVSPKTPTPAPTTSI